VTNPRLSVVLLTLDHFARLRKTISHLVRQTVAHSMELVIVSPAKLSDVNESDLVAFAAVRFVQTSFCDTGHPRAAGAQACSTPLIAFGEDHCFPEPNWAEHLIHVYAGPWAAVSPAMSNANPGAVSDADFLLNFGHSAYPLPETASRMVPWHNTSYPREVLLGYGDRLPHMLEAEVRIHQDLHRRGLEMFMAGSLRVHHVNLSRWGSYLACQYFGGRLYGAARAEAGTWNRGRKLFYTAMLPFIPLRRVAEILRHAKRTGTQRSPLFLFACATGLIASALGEVSGYILGQGDMGRRRVTFEFERYRYLRAADLVYLEPEPTTMYETAEAAGA
jgi:hypothetical protein